MQRAKKKMLAAVETGARQAREEEEEKFINLMDYCKDNYMNAITSVNLDIGFENNGPRLQMKRRGGGAGAYNRQRLDRGKGRGMASKKATWIAGRRRRATSAKHQSRVFDPGVTG